MHRVNVTTGRVRYRAVHGGRRGGKTEGGERKAVVKMWSALTSAGGLPPSDTHSSSTGTFSAAVTVSPCTIRGRSGATSTVSVAFLDRMAGSSRLPTPTWHWYTPSSSSVTGLIVRLYSPENSKRSIAGDTRTDEGIKRGRAVGHRAGAEDAGAIVTRGRQDRKIAGGPGRENGGIAVKDVVAAGR